MPVASGAPRTARGRFRNNHRHERHGRGDFLRFLWSLLRTPWTRPAFVRAINDPSWLAANRTEPTLTWIGHVTFLLQIGGLNVLTDPHFSRRASPLAWAGPERLAPVGLMLHELPAIDLILISHNHYDHLDRRSVRALAGRHPQAVFVVPLGLGEWLRRNGIEASRLVELDWWQSHCLHDARITATPAQHFSGRTARDRNRSLWCGFVLEANDRRVYFAGDTGYCPDFVDIGRRLGPMDLALIPIGAYAPRWFLHPMHVDPAEAVCIHRDVRSRRSVGMHWGSFRLTAEPLDEPPRRLSEALAAAGVPSEQFTVMQHGETLRLFL